MSDLKPFYCRRIPRPPSLWGTRRVWNGRSLSCRRPILGIALRPQDISSKIAGWWFDGVESNTYKAEPHGWWNIYSIVHSANPNAVIAFSWGANEQACVCKGIDDYTGGDTWSKQDLKRLTPKALPPQDGILVLRWCSESESR